MIIHWFSSPTFWAIVGVIIALAIGIVTIAVTYRAASPRRRLTYTVWSDAPLLARTSASMRSRLQISYRDDPDSQIRNLANPHVIWIGLVNWSHKDIQSKEFDQGKPVVIDVGVEIIKSLSITAKSASMAQPSIEARGSALELWPSLIRKRATVEIVILADGPAGVLTCESPLIDIEVREQSNEQLARRRLMGRVAAIAFTVLALVGYIIVARVGYYWPFAQPCAATGASPSGPSTASAEQEGNGQDLLHWGKPACTGGGAIKKYAILTYDVTSAQFWYPITYAAANQSEIVIAGLKPGHVYAFYIIAINSKGYSTVFP